MPGPSYSTSDLNVPPIPSLSNVTSATAFQPYEDQDHDLGDEAEGDLPPCLPRLRALSARFQESALRMPSQY